MDILLRLLIVVVAIYALYKWGLFAFMWVLIFILTYFFMLVAYGLILYPIGAWIVTGNSEAEWGVETANTVLLVASAVVSFLIAWAMDVVAADTPYRSRRSW